MKTVDVYFVRHGQTYFNLMHKMQGWADSPLTGEGIDCVTTTGQSLKTIDFDAVYSSDLKRALDTATIICQQSQYALPKIQQLSTLREVFFGGFEGLNNLETWAIVGKSLGCETQAEIIHRYSIDIARDAMHQADPFGYAEDAIAFWSRFKSARQTLLSKNRNHAKILVVTHGTFLKMLLLKYFGDIISSESAFPENCSVTKIRISYEKMVLLK